jgi:hypothetical protein
VAPTLLVRSGTRPGGARIGEDRKAGLPAGGEGPVGVREVELGELLYRGRFGALEHPATEPARIRTSDPRSKQEPVHFVGAHALVGAHAVTDAFTGLEDLTARPA